MNFEKAYKEIFELTGIADKIYWRSSAGLIDIKEMTTGHIERTINLLSKAESVFNIKWRKILKEELNQRDDELPF